MKKKVVSRMLAAMLCASMVTSLAPAGFVYAATIGQENTEEVTTLAEEATTEISVGFEQGYAKVGVALKAIMSNAPEGASYTYTWYVNNNVVAQNTDTYTPKSGDLEKFIVVSAKSATGQSYEARMYCSKLPVVYINTDNYEPITNKETYLPGNMVLQGNDSYSDSSKLYTGILEIKGRGNTTWGLPKKPYKIKLDKKADIFGFGKNKHWVLLANHLDPSFSRNKLSYDLSGEMGMPSMQSENVALVLNGKYAGTYQLCEHIRIDSGNRIDITDWESIAEDVAKAISKKDTTVDKAALEDAMKEDLGWVTQGTFTFKGNNKSYTISEYYTKALPGIDGGYILELDEYFDEVSKFKSTLNQPIMFNAPEFAISNKDMFEYITGYINSFEEAITSNDGYVAYQGEQVHYSQLFDMDALAQFWIVNELFNNEDAMKKSTYMYKDNDELMKMGPIWDMDWAADGTPIRGRYTAAYNVWQTNVHNSNAQSRQWYKYLTKDPYFAMKAYETYHQYREFIGNLVANTGPLVSGRTFMQEAGMANDNLWIQKFKFIDEVDHLNEWLRNRINWMDAQFASVGSLLSSLGAYNDNQNGTSNKLSIDSIESKATGGLTLKSTLNSSATTVNAYVNGIKVGSATKNAQNQVSIDIPADKLLAGQDNMIVVKATSSWATYTNYQIYSDTSDPAVVNKSALISAIALAKSKEAKDYTTESFATLTQKLAQAETVRDDESATQVAVNTATTELNNAIKALVALEPEEPEQPSDFAALNRANMTATAGSEESLSASNLKEGPARFVLDNNQDTIWHTEWDGSPRDMQYIDINLGATYTVNAIKMLPRSGSINGVITEYEVYTSLDGVNFTKQTAGKWAYPDKVFGEQTASFTATDAKVVRLVSKASMSENLNLEFSSIAELNIIGKTTTAQVDKSRLKAALDTANALVESEYTPASFARVTQAKTMAQGVYENDKATQAEITDAYDAITHAIDQLLKKADKTVLKAKIDEAKAINKENYTELTYRQIEIALESANTTYADEEATQEEVGTRITDIENAIKGLQVKADFKELNRVIEQAMALDESIYTVESYKRVKESLDQARIVAENVDATQQEVDEAKTDLELAIRLIEQVNPEKEGFYKDSNGNYYIEADGNKAQNKWLYIKGSYYYFDGIYRVESNFKKVGADTYYFNQDGKMQSGWQKLNSVWYYLSTPESGKMATGWKQVDGTWYYFNGQGAMQTGWQKINQTWYYLGASDSGKMVTGWKLINHIWYYFEGSGKMVTGWQLIDHVWYYFNGSGSMTTGWQQVGGEWYFMNTSGKMMTGWIEDKGKSYYLESSGKMAKNKWIGKYYVNQSGVWTMTR